jgi:hypothetical protein
MRVLALSAVVFLCACSVAFADAPPDTSLDSGPQGLNTTAMPTFTFSSNVAGATFQCSFDHAPYSACTSPLQLPQLTQGPHVFDVRAVDSTNQVDPTPAERTWTYLPNITAPVISLTSPRSVVRRSKLFALRGTAAAAAGVVSVQVNLMVAGSRHDVPGPHPTQCRFANLHTGKVSGRACIDVRWETARGTTNWSFKLSKKFRTNVAPGRYVVMVRGVNSLGLQKAYQFRRTFRH